MNKNIYHINTSSRTSDSISRRLTAYLVDTINRKNDYNITYRDVGRAEGIRFLDGMSVSGLFIPDEEKSERQKEALKPSDRIINEAHDNDIWVIGVPIYNFAAPAAFKAWADMLARSSKTFKYVDGKPVGLLNNKTVFVIVVSGGAEMNSDIDFCTPWLRHFMHFIGIEDLNIVDATRYSKDREPHIIQDIDERIENNAL